MRAPALSLLYLVFALVCLPSLPSAAEDGRHVERLIGALTDHRRGVHRPAMTALASMGPRVLADLEVLAGDNNPRVRARVAEVAADVGGERAFAILRRLVDDRDAYVREVAVLGLGAVGVDQAFDVLAPRLGDPLPGIRESAALALGQLGDPRGIPDLALWEQGGPEPHRLRLLAGADGERQFKRLQSALRAALDSLVMQPRAIPQLREYLRSLEGVRLRAVVVATWQVGDPRLNDALVELLRRGEEGVRIDAATALAANGDTRCLGPLCARAAEDESPLVRDAAARTLRRLTNHQAGPGRAWTLWWRDHAAEVEALHERDAFLAALHDQDRRASREELASFTPAQLMPLVDGVLGEGAPWWGRQAWHALRRDDAARWTVPLLQRYDRSASDAERVALVVLLDGLGDDTARGGLRHRYELLQDAIAVAGEMHGRGSLRAALRLALDIDTPLGASLP